MVGFGRATDHGLFLLSRIKEARDSGANDAPRPLRRLQDWIGLREGGPPVVAAGP